jgi:Bacteriophage protein GP30.3
MDIRSGAGYPASALSNFAIHHFVFDGVPVVSMEGFLQSLKFDKPHIQVEVCKLAGLEAKRRGRARTKNWQRVQKLWWQGVAYDRHSDDYRQLITRAYLTMAQQSESFRNALKATGNNPLTHSIGRSNPSETILTAAEFSAQLINARWYVTQVWKP